MANFDGSQVNTIRRSYAQNLADEISVFGLTLANNLPGMSTNDIALIVSAVYEGRGNRE